MLVAEMIAAPARRTKRPEPARFNIMVSLQPRKMSTRLSGPTRGFSQRQISSKREIRAT
jgi:hypothetical protein